MANTLIPGYQLSANDIAGPLANQTNLAIKGIIGIKAMSEMAAIVGNSSAAANYSVRLHGFKYGVLESHLTNSQATASSYVSQWQQLAASSDGQHLTLAVRGRPY